MEVRTNDNMQGKVCAINSLLLGGGVNVYYILSLLMVMFSSLLCFYIHVYVYIYMCVCRFYILGAEPSPLCPLCPPLPSATYIVRVLSQMIREIETKYIYICIYMQRGSSARSTCDTKYVEEGPDEWANLNGGPRISKPRWNYKRTGPRRSARNANTLSPSLSSVRLRSIKRKSVLRIAKFWLMQDKQKYRVWMIFRGKVSWQFSKSDSVDFIATNK